MRTFASLAVVAILMTGCASTYVSKKTVGPETYAVGDVAVLSYKTITTTTTNPEGEVVSVVTTVESIESVKTKSAADLELNLRKEDRKENVGVAQAAGQVRVVAPRHNGGGYGYGHIGGWSTRGDIMLPGRSGQNPDGTYWVRGGIVIPR